MNHAEHELGRNCYGYGRWDAPYWFIGPEQGQSAAENNDLKLRHQAFRKLQKAGLCDCAAFHESIHEPRWHHATEPRLQPTWSRLILLLMVFLEKKPQLHSAPHRIGRDKETRREYQRDHWGREHGETCVIELSGLPARNLDVRRERELFLSRRIEFIRERLFGCKPAPTFVVMYGQSAWTHYQKIADIEIDSDDPSDAKPYRVRKAKSTVFAFAKHPVARGLENKYWVRLGKEISIQSNSNRRLRS